MLFNLKKRVRIMKSRRYKEEPNLSFRLKYTIDEMILSPGRLTRD